MFTSQDFFAALEALEQEKRIKKEIFLDALTNALAIAYRRHSGTSKAIEVKLSPKSNRIRIFAYQTVVEEVLDKDKEISLEDARVVDRKYRIGDKIIEEVNSKDFGRIASQTARQVVMQKLKDVETELAYSEVAEKEEQLVTAIVRRKEGRNVFVEIGRTEALMTEKDQLPTDRFNVGDRVKVFVKKIKTGFRGPQLAVTRASAAFVRKLFEAEVPEIADGTVEIKGLVREAGYRTKISVYAESKEIDAVGACVGNRGMRVNAIVSELDNEKIDIIPWCEDVLEYIARALSPARVVAVQADEDERYARAIVQDDMLSLAIGKDGQNARLAARLTGWKIDVRPQSQFKEGEFDEEAKGKAAEGSNALSEEEDIFAGDAVFSEDDELK